MVNKKAIVSIVDQITKKKSPPCKKTLQKIVYLIEAKGFNIGCDYGIHFFGPYSADLDYAVRELSNEGLLEIKYTEMEHLISVVDEKSVESLNNRVVDSVIHEFAEDSASELELIATTLYVYSLVNDTVKVKDGVKKIKGSKYSDSKINTAIARLKKVGYITA